jgi:hypothetical protein
MKTFFKNYKKFIAGVLSAIATAAIPLVSDNSGFSQAEAINVFIAALGAVSILGAGNLPEGVWKYTKEYVAAATTAAMFAVSAISDGSWTTAEVLQVVLTFLGALSVTIAPGPVVTQEPTALTGVVEPPRGRHAA